MHRLRMINLNLIFENQNWHYLSYKKIVGRIKKIIEKNEKTLVHAADKVLSNLTNLSAFELNIHCRKFWRHHMSKTLSIDKKWTLKMTNWNCQVFKWHNSCHDCCFKDLIEFLTFDFERVPQIKIGWLRSIDTGVWFMIHEGVSHVTPNACQRSFGRLTFSSKFIITLLIPFDSYWKFSKM